MIVAGCPAAPGEEHRVGRQLLAQLYLQQTGMPLPPILKTAMGKPYFSESPWHFSITHTRGQVFCALAQQPLGIDVCDCAVVKIADDIPKELVAERLHIEDCGVVRCCEELEDAVTMICTDCGLVGSAEESFGIGDILKTAMGGVKGALETKVINAADYVL